MAGYIGARASVVSSGAERKQTYAITTTTTSLTGLAYTPTKVHVYHNGIRLVDGTDYTATDGSTITLTNAAEDGDEVVVISYATFQTSDTVSAANGGTFAGNVAMSADLTVDTNTLYVDSTNDRVGIGTGSPSADLTVTNGTSSGTLSIGDDAAGSTAVRYLQFGESNDYSIQSNANSYLRFYAEGAEAMRIDSNGNLLVGKTSPSTPVAGVELNSSGIVRGDRDGAEPLFLNRLTSNGMIARFQKDGSTKGNISVTGSSTSYNTSSDYRLKENVTDVTDGITRVKQLAPKRFNFIADPDTTVDGFLAHEAQTVVPEAVTGTQDAVDADGNPEYQGIDQSKLVPLLTAALQEAIAKIETLETEMTSVKSRLDALESA